jgi:nicotinate-nucleotide adenylyltransferase
MSIRNESVFRCYHTDTRTNGCGIATTDERGTQLARTVRLGIFGGTFDPIHLGHLLIAEELKFRLELSRVLFLPSNQPPHKTGQVITPNADRMTMLEKAIDGNPNFAISTVDMERPGLSFTADSLEILHQRHSSSEIFFLMGQDSLRDLPTWHEPNRIAEHARIGVALRPGINVDMNAIINAVPDAKGRIDLVPVPLIQISSREIRRRVASGEPITYHVPSAVEAYIRSRGLYLSE